MVTEESSDREQLQEDKQYIEINGKLLLVDERQALIGIEINRDGKIRELCIFYRRIKCHQQGSNLR